MADGTQMQLLPGMPAPTRWAPSELATLRAVYPVGGLQAVQQALPARSAAAIYMQACKLKLRSPRLKKEGGRRTYPHLPEIDDDIRRAHKNRGERGLWLALAQRHKRPQWYISRRARELGLSLPRTSGGAWSEAEIELLHETAHTTASHAARLFRLRGFTRTPHAIHHKRWLVGCSRGDNGIYTQAALAELLGCSPTHLGKQIRAGDLKARQPHDSTLWLIKERDVRAWLIAKPYALDLRNLPVNNQAWLINVISGQYIHD